MHNQEIAEAIVSKGLTNGVGAKPAQTVTGTIIRDMTRLGEGSPFLRVSPNTFMLKPGLAISPTPLLGDEEESEAEVSEEAGLLTSFGISWRRELVAWSANPNLNGQQQRGARKVNFSRQKGIYLLHDDKNIVYVGRAIDQMIGKRLFDHTTDRLNGRWNRFSWFGVLPVTEDGEIQERNDVQASIETLVTLMEALLIEVIEPPLNRRRGDDIGDREYIQVEDDKIKKRQLEDLMRQIQTRFAAD